jgi:IS5 family transposase
LRSRQAAEDRAAGRKEAPADAEEGTKRRAFGEPPEKKQDNFTDPESRIMKTSSGFEQCYNGQLAVDSESRLILAAKVTQSAADHDELLPVLEEVRANVGEFPQVVLADAGYRSEENLQGLEAVAIDAYVALGREGKTSVMKDEVKHPATQRMKKKLETAEGRKRYSKRKSIVEPVNGWIKSVLGFRQFSLRGLQKVSGEWTLVCLALNLRQMSPQLEWT